MLPVSDKCVDGAVDKPLLTSPNGYIDGGHGQRRPSGRARFPSAQLRLSLDGGVISVHVDDGKNGTHRRCDPDRGLMTALTPQLQAFGICPGNATYDQVNQTVVQGADLVGGARNLQDTARDCDAISSR